MRYLAYNKSITYHSQQQMLCSHCDSSIIVRWIMLTIALGGHVTYYAQLREMTKGSFYEVA
jgi:hypothetical protein